MKPGEWPSPIPVRLLIQRVLRGGLPIEKGGVCAGAEEGYPEYRWARTGCPAVDTVSCAKCGTNWMPDDTSAPGRCPNCQELVEIRVNRCDTCPLNHLDWLRFRSRAGQLFEQATMLDSVLGAPLQVGWNDINIEAFNALMALREERLRFLDERREQTSGPQET